MKLGGLGVLGGLAYKAFTNYQAGKPLTAGVPLLDSGAVQVAPVTPAPAISGFTPADHSQDSALLLLRTMVAAAAADGVVDPAERARIAGQVHGMGLDSVAAAFLEAQLKAPATAADIAAEIGGKQELAVQAYAVARAISATLSAPEQAFLQTLAQALKLDPALVAHIDAAVAGQPTA